MVQLALGGSGQSRIDPLAEALLRSSGRPVRNIGQGVASLAEAFAAKRRMDSSQQADLDAANELAAVLGGGGGGGGGAAGEPAFDPEMGVGSAPAAAAQPRGRAQILQALLGSSNPRVKQIGARAMLADALAKPQAPTLKEIKSGDEFLTVSIDPRTGAQNVLARAPRQLRQSKLLTEEELAQQGQLAAIRGRAQAANITLNQNKPMSLSDLLRIRIDGEVPAPGTTGNQLREAQKAGKEVRIVSTDEAKQSAKSAGASRVLDELDDMAFGENGLFLNQDPGLLQAASRAGTAAIERISQSDPRFAVYDGFANGTVAPLIKALGESGTLATGDIDRAVALIPNMFKDTTKVAREKMKRLRKIIEPAIIKQAENDAAGWTTLPGGIKVRRKP